ncbi:MAG: hypothetical protein OH319_01915 [Candidatus Parvarchaeota archaeon]|nr:hypothetical protein [Candidatus Jingweiarchaeum tengchongense]MCW1298127.1 hypothetical protein [Candidatus Jingweiarchaeum tengchongense]MCW1299926.1 hypothetical protein [Candidatus Jingweiarchaeum tengchongense]MCW1305121.1 hypothetical protein [Candidatus Jingweiarchaeum tengchongense]MCW1305548.1 hypothetical protein [Candidatus Jingweiarchaeum tengchongense]
MKSQVAIEYMILISLILLLLVPIWIYLMLSRIQLQDDLSISYAKDAVNRIKDAADLVYIQGSPARVKVNIYIPENVHSINFTDRTIIIKLRTSAGLVDIHAETLANITGQLPVQSGYYEVIVKSEVGYVNVTI